MTRITANECIWNARIALHRSTIPRPRHAWMALSRGGRDQFSARAPVLGKRRVRAVYWYFRLREFGTVLGALSGADATVYRNFAVPNVNTSP